ncbi:OLC1v1027767C1 [Oldenlandia corymbosa var. corymbosa]|uniref:OLC1v1027767C1 n=1 Tax=Oldenlandia corymbosa var. corymbosa TaxID=529605 RepID=A0AAV1CAZ5_OLDCO|nr:OLC1v1027767C1 [Oldenlandia corymbosa var. corymbosa]
MKSYNFSPFSLFFIIPFLALHFHASTTEAQVPQKATFTVYNQGDFGEYITEYDAGYRILRHDEDIFFAFPFRLCFYNTTPGEFILGLRAGVPNDEDLMRWVWDANRNHPVKENATFSLGRDGNLVLANPDGRIVWQTNTANKGVTGFKLLSNGNMVLHDKKGKFIWQSFDYPVDTLLVGMSVRRNGINKLVSRTSDVDGRDGKYSLVLENNGFNLYLNNSGKLIAYNGWGQDPSNRLTSIRFNAEPIDQDPKSAGWELLLEQFNEAKPPPPPRRSLLQSFPVGRDSTIILRKVNYNASISFFRLGSDGNVRVFTYFDKVPYLKWSETWAFFSSYYVRECGQPEKCGAFGLCQKGMCVACPSPKGLLGWSDVCAPPTLKPCSAAGKVDYYKIVGVEHFLNRESTGNGEGPITVEACRDKCNKDCECKGFVYKQDIKKCLRLPVLGTLIRDANTSTAYIKYSL